MVQNPFSKKKPSTKERLSAIRKNSSLKSEARLNRIEATIEGFHSSLGECEALASPALTVLSTETSNLQTQLKELYEHESLTSEPPSTGFLVKAWNGLRPSQHKKFSQKLDLLEKETEDLSVEISNTSVRRKRYKTIYSIITSHQLPSEKEFPPDSKRTDLILTSIDAVQEEYEVVVKEGSHLDSSKYQVSGPQLIFLAQKTINFIVNSQDIKGQLKGRANDLAEICDILHRHVLQIACYMSESPDEEQTHVDYIRAVSSVIDDLQIVLNNPKFLTTVAPNSLSTLQTRESALKALRKTQFHDTKELKDISETQDEIIFFVNDEKHVLKKSGLTWEDVQKKGLSPLEIPTMEVTEVEHMSNLPGGFASIHSASLLKGPKVALKGLSGYCENVLCARFIRELYIWWKAGSHPNVHQLIGICRIEPNHPPSMCSLWCDDGNLWDYLKIHQSDMSRSEQIEIALQVARGLRYLHSCDIVHSDLKPDNILLQDRKAKIYDFGLSRIMNGARGLSSRQHGNWAYQAPEVIEALRGEEDACATAESDIYCFGNILFQCLTGLEPFPDRKNAEVYKAVVKESKHPLSPEYGNKIEGPGSQELTRLLKDCWHNVPATRLSADVVVNQLEKILESITPATTDAAR